MRTEQLSYRHYEILAKLPEPEQREWVELATTHCERVPSRQLANSITLAEKKGEQRIFTKEEIVSFFSGDKPAFIDAPEPALDRFIRSMERQDFSEWTPRMKAHLWRRWQVAAKLMEAMGE